MLITDFKKFERRVETYPQSLNLECKPAFDKLEQIIDGYKYSDRHHKLLLSKWLHKDDEIAAILDFNPSTIGNKKGKMTKEIESVLPRDLMKKLNHINESITKSKINNEKISESDKRDLQDIEETINLAKVDVKELFCHDLIDYCHDSLDLSHVDEDYTMLDIQKELKALIPLTVPFINSQITNLDKNKLSYIFKVLFNHDKETIGMYRSIVDTLMTSLQRKHINLEPDVTVSSGSGGTLPSGAESPLSKAESLPRKAESLPRKAESLPSKAEKQGSRKFMTPATEKATVLDENNMTNDEIISESY